MSEFEKLLKEQHNSMVKTFQDYRDVLLANFEEIERNYERVKDNYPSPNEELIERMMGLIVTDSDKPDIIRGALWALLREAVPIEE